MAMEPYSALEKNLKFKVGDRVKIKWTTGSWPTTSIFLQKDNLVGTIVGTVANGYSYWLKMDKPVKRETSRKDRPHSVIIPEGYAFYGFRSELELLESAESQKPINIWSVEAPKVEKRDKDKPLPEIWKDRVLAKA